MKRLSILLALLAAALVAVVAVAPGLLGGPAEDLLERQLDLVSAANPEVTVLTEGYQRDWLGADARHRVIIDDPELAAALQRLFGGEAFADQPAVVITSRIAHGPVPIGSFAASDSRIAGSGSLAPALAHAVSTLELDPGDGELVPLPGRIATSISLTGRTRAHYGANAGAAELGSGPRVRWEGAELRFELDRDGRGLGIEGRVDPLRLETRKHTLALGALSIDTRQTLAAKGFATGTGRYELAALEAADAGRRLALSGIALETASALDEDGLARIRLQLSVDDLAAPTVESLGLDLDLALERVPPHALRRVLATLQRAPEGAGARGRVLLPLIEDDLREIAAHGPRLELKALRLTFPAGAIEGRLRLELSRGEAVEGRSLPAVLGPLAGSAALAVPEPLLDAAARGDRQLAEQVAMLRGLGFFRLDDGVYRLEAEYRDGVLSVNGIPMPLGLPSPDPGETASPPAAAGPAGP